MESQEKIYSEISDEEKYKPSKEIEKSFFLELRNLCSKYRVCFYNSDMEYVKNNQIKELPAIYFEFLNGDTYIWTKGFFSSRRNNTFENVDGYNNISIHGVQEFLKI